MGPSMTKCRCVGCNKSNLMIGPFKRVGMLQSMPTLSTNPRDLKRAVSLAVPAKTSAAKIWLMCCPCSVQLLAKLSFGQRCSWSEWCLKHPGSAQRCKPREQASPGVAALHPFRKLNDQCFTYQSCGESPAVGEVSPPFPHFQKESVACCSFCSFDLNALKFTHGS